MPADVLKFLLVHGVVLTGGGVGLTVAGVAYLMNGARAGVLVFAVAAALTAVAAALGWRHVRRLERQSGAGDASGPLNENE